jgi:hypothetical protein
VFRVVHPHARTRHCDSLLNTSPQTCVQHVLLGMHWSHVRAFTVPPGKQFTHAATDSRCAANAACEPSQALTHSLTHNVRTRRCDALLNVHARAHTHTHTHTHTLRCTALHCTALRTNKVWNHCGGFHSCALPLWCVFTCTHSQYARSPL